MKNDQEKITLSKVYIHIDNGGINMEVFQINNNEWKNVFIEMDCSYYGYPSVKSTLQLWGVDDKKVLTELGMKLIEAASKL